MGDSVGIVDRARPVARKLLVASTQRRVLREPCEKIGALNGRPLHVTDDESLRAEAADGVDISEQFLLLHVGSAARFQPRYDPHLPG